MYVLARVRTTTHLWYYVNALCIKPNESTLLGVVQYTMRVVGGCERHKALFYRGALDESHLHYWYLKLMDRSQIFSVI